MLDEKPDLNIIATHEAAHFVVAMLGYNYEKKSINYKNKPEDEIPTEISIVASDSYSGYCEIPCKYEITSIRQVPNFRQSWHILTLLVGYAAETSYGFSNQFNDLRKVKKIFEDAKEHSWASDDFSKVTSILEQLIDPLDMNFDKKFINNAATFWERALQVVKEPVVKKAILKTTILLLDKKVLLKEEIRTLKDNNLGVDMINKYFIKLPKIKV